MSIVSLLLDFGASAAHVTPYEDSPILLASRQGSASIIELLLERGASAEASGLLSRVTPLVCAATKAAAEAQATVIGHSSAGADAAAALLRHGAAPDQAAGNGATPLWLAACSGNAALEKLLREAGAVRHMPQVCACSLGRLCADQPSPRACTRATGSQVSGQLGAARRPSHPPCPLLRRARPPSASPLTSARRGAPRPT